MRSLAVFTGVLAGLFCSQGVPADDWTVDRGASTLGFTATYDEIPFEGRFRNFDARIRFDPERPDTGAFLVTVDVGSVDTDSSDRDEGMQEADWFDTAKHPQAGFESNRIVKLGDGEGYSVTGDLTIKGITRPVTLAFTWQLTDAFAHLVGSGNVMRGDFDIGTGDWADDDTIGFDVRIQFDLTLSR